MIMEEIVVDVEAILSSMNTRLETADDEEEERQEATSYTIYKVPKNIREEDTGAYVPKNVSIGPFHWKKKKELLPMEQIKWVFIRDLITRHQKNTLENYIKKVSSKVKEARKCYSQETFLEFDDDKDFVEMLVLDGCFIIELFLKFFLGEYPDILYTAGWDKLPLVRNDLLLLENQIPFFVLQCLFDSSVIPGLSDFLGEEVGPDTLKVLAQLYFIGPARSDVSFVHEVHHLLHLVHSFLCPTSSVSDEDSFWWIVLLAIPRVFMYVSHMISYIFVVALSWLVYGWRYQRPKLSRAAFSSLLYGRPPRRPGVRRTIRSATELLEAGIKFRKKEAASCFLDITFRNDTMEIPRLSIQEATISRFRNLLVFELVRPDSGSRITTYITLMDRLIDTAEDVALLVRCGVLENQLGSNEEVALFFNNTGRSVSPDIGEDHYLSRLFREVEEYCATPRHRHWARLERDYLSSPWSFISLLAASVLLLLTILSTFFAVFAYFLPPTSPT